MRIVVTGANRGIGLELTRQLLERGDSVVATARDPEHADALKSLHQRFGDRLWLVRLDVSSDGSAAELVKALPDGPLDGLINNAGTLGKMATFSELDLDDAVRTFQTNALGALRVTRALLPRLRQGSTKRVLNVSTGMGSVADNTSGGAFSYRISKAALNMATRNLAHTLRSDGIAVVVVNPGWVQTDMGGAGATMPVDESARRLLAIFDSLDLATSGSFLNYDGTTFPW
jgi:NAD(P)-dependent dehydrogenase (short-subunit alcohol dehydrogenase family)